MPNLILAAASVSLTVHSFKKVLLNQLHQPTGGFVDILLKGAEVHSMQSVFLSSLSNELPPLVSPSQMQPSIMTSKDTNHWLKAMFAPMHG